MGANWRGGWQITTHFCTRLPWVTCDSLKHPLGDCETTVKCRKQSQRVTCDSFQYLGACARGGHRPHTWRHVQKVSRCMDLRDRFPRSSEAVLCAAFWGVVCLRQALVGNPLRAATRRAPQSMVGVVQPVDPVPEALLRNTFLRSSRYCLFPQGCSCLIVPWQIPAIQQRSANHTVAFSV